MKKAVLLIALLMTIHSAHAYMLEYTTSDIKSLQGTGYSQATMQVVDKARMLNQGHEKDYVPFYSRKYYSSNPFAKWYQVAKNYFDPASSEEVFGSRELHFNNAWFDMSPSYLKKDAPNDLYQRLYDKDLKRLEVAGKVIKGSDGVEPAVEDVQLDSNGNAFLLEDL